MITIQVCVGSSCYLRGAKEVIECLQALIEEHGLQREVCLKGRFCMDKCTNGATVQINEQILTNITPEGVPALFREYVVSQIETPGKDD